MKKAKILNDITEKVIGAAIEVHRQLGPGLLESTYEACLVFELSQRKINYIQQKPLPVTYKGVQLDCGYRLDLLVEEDVIIEIKSAESILPIHKAQLLSYLKISGCKLGLLINFNVEQLKKGIQRVVNNFPEDKG